jgi:hypothetical protein
MLPCSVDRYEPFHNVSRLRRAARALGAKRILEAARPSAAQRVKRNPIYRPAMATASQSASDTATALPGAPGSRRAIGLRTAKVKTRAKAKAVIFIQKACSS